jgi:hypothetical protein
MKRFFLTSVFVVILILGYAQNVTEINSDTLNRFNKNGKKHGYWVELLNKKFHPVKKEKDASYFWYVLYLNGQRMVIKTYPPSFYAGIFYPANFKYTGTSSENGIILLDGKMSVYRKKHNLLLWDFTFINGKLIDYKEYYENKQISLNIIYDDNNYYWKCYSITGIIEEDRCFTIIDNKWVEKP